MNRIARRLSPLLFVSLLLLGLGACSPAEEQQQQEAEPVSTELKDLPPAVAEPAPEARVMDDFETRGLEDNGLPLSMQLPEGVVVKFDQELNGWLLFNEDESFKLVAVSDQTAMEDIAQYWKSSPEQYTFRKMILETPKGILFEMENDGQVEYHVDYSVTGPEFLRIYSAKDRAFSQYQAEKMFHACRTIKG